MGDYARLYIDRIYLSWKGYVPTFLTFLFREGDFYVVRNPDDPDWPEEIGFRTTCRHSIEILERNRYSIEFFASVYEFFECELHDSFEECAKHQIIETSDRDLDETEVTAVFAAHLARFPQLTRQQELEDFMRFLGVLLASDFKTPPFDEPVRLKFRDEREYEIPPSEYLFAKCHKDLRIIDFENLQMYVLDKPLRFPPWILKLSSLFDYDYLFHYPEVVSLMFVRLVLASVPPDAEVKLDLHDIIDVEGSPEEQERSIRESHSSLVYSLVEKISLYNRVFEPLLRNEGQVREQYIKSECRDLLLSCDAASSSSEKGRILERLTELLFTANRHFELVDKRVSTGDEEIDLVVKNNIDRPFWNALQSSLFFIECKNWRDPVGARELRDFEGKLRNHAKLAKVGFFVSIGGFTSAVKSELMRAGRGEQLVVLLDRSDLDEYLRGSEDFFPWLETRTARLH
ncbi:MAG: restriction endonuclease [Phycisphaerales bacterium]|nr:restriction endonuclease [Phycisphaerales bacterium]